jgi:Leucine-rich repeat (LRR) protein
MIVRRKGYGESQRTLADLLPHIGLIVNNEAGEEALIALLTLNPRPEESRMILQQQRDRATEDQQSIIDAAAREALNKQPTEPLGQRDYNRLTELLLHDKPVTDAGVKLLVELKSSRVDQNSPFAMDRKSTPLRLLGLEGTQVTDAGLEHLEGLESLERLWLARAQISNAGLENLKKLKSLQRLALGDTQVTDEGLVHLKELKSLALLSLIGTKVTDAGVEHLKEIKALQRLWLSGTKVTDAGVAELKKALPECKIIR